MVCSVFDDNCKLAEQLEVETDEVHELSPPPIELRDVVPGTGAVEKDF